MSDRNLYRWTSDGFRPADTMAQHYCDGLKMGEIVELKATKVRNGQYHRLFFAIMKLISDNSEPHISPKAALHFAKLATGTGEFVDDSKGDKHFIPGSISFAKMDQAAFSAFVQEAIPPIVGRFMVGSAPDDVIKEAMELA
jgi:hypothetical protein